MSLSNPQYLALLLVVFVIFYALRPGQPRRLLLLAASYFFYFELSRYYVAVLLFVTLVTYYGARALASNRDSKSVRFTFVGLCALLLAPMVLFKYTSAVFAALGWRDFGGGLFATIAIPVGISFFTFTALGYLIDVYTEVIEPDSRFPHVALFLAFFPLVSAGPIERGGRFLPQLDCLEKFSADRGLAGLRCILMGLVLKVCIASALLGPVSKIDSARDTFAPLEQFFGTIYYAFYVYTDFAGYSLIAIGSAILFGLKVAPNFQQPFLSATIPEFWRTWHISLSSWIRDYLFTPLRMEWRRSGNLGMAAALLLSFTVIGVWHGATLGFLVFGVMHGVLCVTSTFTLGTRNKLIKWLHLPASLVSIWRAVITLVLVALTFVVWHAASITEAMTIYRTVLSLDLLRDIATAFRWYAFHRGHLIFTLGERWWSLIAAVIACDLLARRKVNWEKVPVALQFGAYALAFIFVLSNWLAGQGHEPFLYYRF
jgi:hypothetical protein